MEPFEYIYIQTAPLAQPGQSFRLINGKSWVQIPYGAFSGRRPINRTCRSKWCRMSVLNYTLQQLFG